MLPAETHDHESKCIEDDATFMSVRLLKLSLIYALALLIKPQGFDFCIEDFFGISGFFFNPPFHVTLFERSVFLAIIIAQNVSKSCQARAHISD